MSEATSGTSTLGRRFDVTVVLCGIAFGMTFAQVVGLAQKIGIGDSKIGLLVSAMAPMMLVVDLFGANRIARLAPRICLAASLVLYGMGNLVLGMVADFSSLLVGRCLQGAGIALFMTGGAHLVLASTAPGRRVHALGRFNAAWFLGIAIAPPIGGVIGQMSASLGPRLSFTTCGLFSLVLSVPVWATLPRTSNAEGSLLHANRRLPRPWLALRRRSALGVGVLGESIRESTQLVLCPAAALAIGFGPLDIGLLLGAVALIDVIFMRWGGALVDRIGGMRLLIGTCALGIIALMLMPLALESSPSLFIVLCILLGPPIATTWVLPTAMVVNLATDPDQSIRAYRLSVSAAMGLSTLVSGAVLGITGPGDALAWMSIGLVGTIACVFSAGHESFNPPENEADAAGAALALERGAG